MNSLIDVMKKILKLAERSVSIAVLLIVKVVKVVEQSVRLNDLILASRGQVGKLGIRIRLSRLSGENAAALEVLVLRLMSGGWVASQGVCGKGLEVALTGR